MSKTFELPHRWRHAGVLLCLGAAQAQNGPYEVTCQNVSIPTLSDPWPHLYRSARVCYPKTTSNSLFPLHVFAHGDFGGGAFFWPGYHGLHEQLASYGFVVPAYLSCWVDQQCNNGETSFLEALKTIEHLEAHPNIVPIDFNKPYTVSGHSTGARVAMMLAALKDSPDYLKGTKLAPLVTDPMRKILNNIAAFVGDHTDPMNDPKQNPDIPNYQISKSPVFLITGSRDSIEPTNSSWQNFRQISTTDKVFVNFQGDTHVTPNLGHHSGPLVAFFARYHALGDMNAYDKIYSNKADSLVNSRLLAQAGSKNNGEGVVSFLACSSKGAPIPQKFQHYCSGETTSSKVIV